MQTGESFDSFAGIESSSVKSLMIHAARSLTPTVVNLAGTPGNGEVVVAMNQHQRHFGKDSAPILRTLRWHLR